MWARAVMSSCVGEKPQDANERGQHTTRTDVLTAQFLWEPAPHPHPLLTTTNISLLLLSLLIALAKAWQAPLMLLPSSFMRAQALLVELSHQLQLYLSSPSACVKCVFMRKGARVWISACTCGVLVFFFNQGWGWRQGSVKEVVNVVKRSGPRNNTQTQITHTYSQHNLCAQSQALLVLTGLDLLCMCACMCVL